MGPESLLTVNVGVASFSLKTRDPEMVFRIEW
jgi:hypothetical protein